MSEKYQAYLCSREWALKRRAVFERECGDDGVSRCERCKWRDGKVVHHNTYARLYDESLTDLTLLCDVCHAYQHGKENEIDAAKVIEEAKEFRDMINYAMRLAGLDPATTTIGVADIFVIADCHNPAWRGKMRK